MDLCNEPLYAKFFQHKKIIFAWPWAVLHFSKKTDFLFANAVIFAVLKTAVVAKLVLENVNTGK